MFYQENQNKNCFSTVDTDLNIETRSWSKHKDTKTLWRKAQAGAETTLRSPSLCSPASLWYFSGPANTLLSWQHQCVSPLCVCVCVCVCVCMRVCERERERRCVGGWTCNWPRETETERQRGREAEFNQSYEQRVLHAQPCHFTVCVQYSVFQWQILSRVQANDWIFEITGQKIVVTDLFLWTQLTKTSYLCTQQWGVCVCVCLNQLNPAVYALADCWAWLARFQLTSRLTEEYWPC